MVVVVSSVLVVVVLSLTIVVCVYCYRSGWYAGVAEGYDRGTRSTRGRRAFERDAPRTADTEARTSIADFRSRSEGFDF